MVTTNGYATLAELEGIMEIDFSEDLQDALGNVLVSDTTIENRGSVIESFLIGLINQTYDSTTIPVDVQAYFLRAWEMDIEQFLWKRDIKIIKQEPTDDWMHFLESNFAKVIEDDVIEGNIIDFDSFSE